MYKAECRNQVCISSEAPLLTHSRINSSSTYFSDVSYVTFNICGMVLRRDQICISSEAPLVTNSGINARSTYFSEFSYLTSNICGVVLHCVNNRIVTERKVHHGISSMCMHVWFGKFEHFSKFGKKLSLFENFEKDLEILKISPSTAETRSTCSLKNLTKMTNNSDYYGWANRKRVPVVYSLCYRRMLNQLFQESVSRVRERDSYCSERDAKACCDLKATKAINEGQTVTNFNWRG